MAVAVWPAALPQIPLANGYKEGSRDNAVKRTRMADGPAKQKRGGTHAELRPMTFALTNTQYQTIWKPFVETTLSVGSLPFYWPDPLDGGANKLVRLREGQWEATIENASSDGPIWFVTLQTEFMP